MGGIGMGRGDDCLVSGCPHEPVQGKRYCRVHDCASDEPSGHLPTTENKLLAGEDSELVRALAGDPAAPKACPVLPKVTGVPGAKEIAEAMSSYLNSQACMLLFSKLTLYRACGENPKIKVSYSGMKFRVSVERSNGEVESFNRDGES